MEPRIGIVGAGAIGCVVGGMLARAGHDVTLIDQWPEHVDKIKRDGLRLSGTIEDQTVPVTTLHVHELQTVSEPFDLVFIAVKGYDTEWATTLILPHLAPDGLAVDFQNGINDERVANLAGRDRTLGCVITIGAGLYEPGHALRTDTRPTGFKIGELDGRETDRARQIARIMSDVAGTEVTTNLWGGALGEARGELHGQPDRRTHRVWLRGCAQPSGHAGAVHPPRGRGNRGW